jgi:DNA-nicking Smr family endonuclease
MKKKPELPSPPDAELFRQVLDGVIPLAPSNRVTSSPPPHRPLIHSTSSSPVADTLSDHGAGNETLTEFLRPGISRMVLRKLRRGQFPIQDSLDLHGLNSDEARKLLLEFLRHATQHDLRHVCVIHGKGWHTDGGEGILKTRTRHWLTQCTEVLAFCEAPPHAGGGGAVWVLLKAQG